MPCVLEKKRNKDPFPSEGRRNTARVGNDISVSFGGQCFLLRGRNLLLPGQEADVFLCLFIDKAGKPIYN